jgi:Kelch motif
LLPSGMVLIAGGNDNSGFFASAELYDPSTGMFAATGSMTSARVADTATLLPSGMVLIAAGFDGSDCVASAELYDASAGTFAATGNMAAARDGHKATLLPNGKVLISGGYGYDYLVSAEPHSLASAEIYDPAAGTFAATGNMDLARYTHTATLLPNGKVLIAGGFNRINGDPASVELYDPAAGTFTAIGSMAVPREDHTATLLGNGQVLIAGGMGGGASFLLASAEIYQ